MLNWDSRERNPLVARILQSLVNPYSLVPERKKTMGEKKKFSFNFDFLQKLGKVLMTVIAVMPAAGLMISIGKLARAVRVHPGIADCHFGPPVLLLPPCTPPCTCE